MSFSLISLSSSSPLTSKSPPLVYVSELSSPSSNATTRSSALSNPSLFIRGPTHSHHRSTWSFPINSNSNLSSMFTGRDACVDPSTRCASANDDLGVSDSDDDELHQHPQCHHNEPSSPLPDRWHVLGLGQAMVLHRHLFFLFPFSVSFNYNLYFVPLF